MSFDDAQKCGKKGKRNGKPCRNPAMPNGACRMHGGKTPVGIASANFIHGKYSDAIPKNLAQKYNKALEDPELTSTRSNIALIDTLLQERLEKLYKGETREFWLELRSLFSRYRHDIKLLGFLNTSEDEEFPEIIEFEIDRSEKEKKKKKDPRSYEQIKKDSDEYLERMTEIIQRGFEVYDVYERVEAMLEQHRKLTESENKRLEKLQQIITAEKALAIIYAVADSVKRNVSDPKQLSAISSDIAGIVNRDFIRKDQS